MNNEKRIEANKSNSKLSTGPRDTSKTRFNALKHGLLSKKVLRIIDKNDKKFMQYAKKGLIEQFGPPDNIVEEILYENFQIACWRLRHVNDVEAVHNERMFQDRLAGDIRCSELGFMKDPRTDKRASDLVYAPVNDEMELICRYRASAEREFYRTLEEINKWKNGFVSQKR